MTLETRQYVGATLVVETNRRWSDEDLSRMHQLVEQGYKNSEMQFYLNRTQSAIRSKRWRLNKKKEAG